MNAFSALPKALRLATETTHKVQLITGVHEYLLNRPLQTALQQEPGNDRRAAIYGAGARICPFHAANPEKRRKWF